MGRCGWRGRKVWLLAKGPFIEGVFRCRACILMALFLAGPQNRTVTAVVYGFRRCSIDRLDTPCGNDRKRYLWYNWGIAPTPLSMG